jgi:menaquinone-dependent protoporphyrinogen oxidase
MENRILVTYASQAGATAGVAEAIGKSLEEGGAQVDVLPMQQVTDLAPYRAVVAGSAIHGQKWLPEAMQFMRAHQAELARKPFASFMVCITLSMANAGQYLEGLKGWMTPVRSLIRPVSEGYFAGSLDFSRLPFSMNVLGMRLVVLLGIWKQGDHRDWHAIRAWAENLRPLLLP